MNDELELVECQLCGHIGEDVSVALAWYRDLRGVRDITRCLDADACQHRVEELGRVWPLRRSDEVEA